MIHTYSTCLLHLHCAVIMLHAFEGWGIHNKELDDFYASSNIRAIISPRMKSVWNVAHNGENRNPFRFFWVGGKGEFGGGGWKPCYDLKMNIQRVCGMYLSVAWWRPVVGSCKHLCDFFGNKNVNFLTSCTAVAFWRWILLHGIST